MKDSSKNLWAKWQCSYAEIPSDVASVNWSPFNYWIWKVSFLPDSTLQWLFYTRNSTWPIGDALGICSHSPLLVVPVDSHSSFGETLRWYTVLLPKALQLFTTKILMLLSSGGPQSSWWLREEGIWEGDLERGPAQYAQYDHSSHWSPMAVEHFKCG